MPTITMEAEGETLKEALYNLSMNVEAAVGRVEAADVGANRDGDEPGAARDDS